MSRRAVLALASALAITLVVGWWLLRSREPELRVTLIPGQSIWEHARRLAPLGPGAPDELVQLAADERYVRDTLDLDPFVGARAPRTDGVAATWLEGLLFPDTYFFDDDATVRDVVARATLRFVKVWNDLAAAHSVGLRARAESGLGPAELVVLASLVEEETQDPAEAPRIAGVFLNRLAKGMRLETDPTLMYRPDRVAKAPTPSERRDDTNPYNTYKVKGLPPGPICSPGKVALRAVLEPERHDYLFFVARRDGSKQHAFATTLAEHEANIDRFLRKVTRPAAP